MTDPFHHKHPYLTVLVLLVIVLVASDWLGFRRGGHHHHDDGMHGQGWPDRGGYPHAKWWRGKWACPEGMDRWVESNLIMGQGSAGGREVTEADWQDFLEADIRPRLPLGFSVHNIDGHWGENGEFHREPAKILLLLHDGSERETLDAIVDAYMERFERNLVLSYEAASCVRFVR